MVIGSGPPLTTLSLISPGAGSQTRCTLSVSIGGAVRAPSPASLRTIQASTAASSSNGTSAQTSTPGVKRCPGRTIAADSEWVGALADIEDPHPAELGEFGDVRVEHVHPRLVILEGELEDAALCLNLGDGVDVAQRWFQRRTGVVVVEEVGVQVERVEEIELHHIDHV